MVFVGMNVVMPTAMITMHQSEELSAGSARTAERGIRILKALRDYPTVMENIKAIVSVANDLEEENVDIKLVQVRWRQRLVCKTILSGVFSRLLIINAKFWTNFFEKWGYTQVQRNDIAAAMDTILL